MAFMAGFNSSKPRNSAIAQMKELEQYVDSLLDDGTEKKRYGLLAQEEKEEPSKAKGVFDTLLTYMRKKYQETPPPKSHELLPSDMPDVLPPVRTEMREFLDELPTYDTPEAEVDVILPEYARDTEREGLSMGLMSSPKPKARPAYELPDVDTSGVDVPLSAVPDPNKVASHSYVNKPIIEGEGRGNSRRAGDAPKEVIDKSIKTIIAAGQRAGMSKDEIALTLAIARHESGFNPDAAAPSTSAHGLGQFINKTGAGYGLTDENRWDVEKQAEALVSITKDNIALAKKRGKGTEYVYKYHHDGPSGEYGGLKTSKNKVMPYVDYFKNMLGE
jgi:hypothetical protein